MSDRGSVVDVFENFLECEAGPDLPGHCNRLSQPAAEELAFELQKFLSAQDQEKPFDDAAVMVDSWNTTFSSPCLNQPIFDWQENETVSFRLPKKEVE